MNDFSFEGARHLARSLDRCSIRDDPNLTIIRFSRGINANRDVRRPRQRSRGLKSNRKSSDANKNGDTFPPTPFETRAMLSVLCLPLVFPPIGKIARVLLRDGRRRNFEALTVAKGNFIVYYHRIKGRREKRRKEKERTKEKGKRNSRYLKGRDISFDCIKSRSNRTEGIGGR